MKFWKSILLVFMVIGMTSCRDNIGTVDSVASPQAGDEDTSIAYSKYEDPIVIRVGFKVPDSRLNTGDSNDNNPITRYLESITNIKVVHSWEAKGEDAFTQKVQLAIDSNDLPDAMVVDRDQLKKLIDNDMIEDLTETYKIYGSELIKDMYNSTKERH